MAILELLKTVLLGIIEGITEWLPVSSTGHMILFDSFWPMDPSQYKGGQAFIDLFLVVIQLGAILAVLVLYRHKLNPWSRRKTLPQRRATWSLWGKVIVGVIPAGIAGVLLDDFLFEHLYNAVTVAVALIVYGVAFLFLENRRRSPRVRSVDALDYKTAVLIGCFQALSIIPGTSRSGSTILGAMILGCARGPAAEFSFFLAIPTMLGASALQVFKYFLDYGFGFTSFEVAVLVLGMAVAFIVSVAAIRGLMKFVQKHDFKPFGWYRIALGALVLVLFFCNVLKL